MKILVVLKLTKVHTNINPIVSVVFFYLEYLARTIEIADLLVTETHNSSVTLCKILSISIPTKFLSLLSG